MVNGYRLELNEIEQILGRALGYPRYGADPANFPGMGDSPDVCVGDHTAVTLAAEIAEKLRHLRNAQQALAADAEEVVRFWRLRFWTLWEDEDIGNAVSALAETLEDMELTTRARDPI